MERFTLEFTLPEGKSLYDEEARPFVEWIAQCVVFSEMNGISCRLFVNGKVEEVLINVREDKNEKPN